MGTRFEIVLCGRGGDAGPSVLFLETCAEAALDEIAFLDGRLSLFRKESYLSHINASAGDGPVRLDGELFDLLDTCRKVNEASLGAFDITVGPLMRSFGFHQCEGKELAEEARGAARTAVGQNRLIIDEEKMTVSFSGPGTSIDLGGAGKGFAIDSAARLLREEGIRNALIHGGTSTVAALGTPPRRSGWEVGIRDPRSREDRTERAMVRRVRLRDEALAVSAPHGRFFRKDGRMEGHVMDPIEGKPAQGALLAAAVSRSALEADAWSTAFLAAGPERFSDLAARAPDVTALMMDSKGKISIRGPRREIFVKNPAEPETSDV